MGKATEYLPSDAARVADYIAAHTPTDCEVSGVAVFRGTRAVVTLVLVLIVPVWVLLSQAASKNFYFELAGAASVLSGRRWLIVLGLPGVRGRVVFVRAVLSRGSTALFFGRQCRCRRRDGRVDGPGPRPFEGLAAIGALTHPGTASEGRRTWGSGVG